MNSEISKVIGKRINALLAKKFKRQKDLATALGVNDNTISYFVSGKRMPNTEQIIKISDFFGVSADYLLGLSDTPTADKDIQFICEYTNLSVQSVKELHEPNSTLSKFINFCLGENENMIAFTTLITNFHLYKAWFRQKVEFKTTLLGDTTNKNIEQKEAVEFVEKDSYLNDKINVAEFSVHKQIAELLNLYTKSEKKEDEKNKNDYDYIIMSLQNEVLDTIESNLIKGSENNVNNP